jgi:hypothetical protein
LWGDGVSNTICRLLSVFFSSLVAEHSFFDTYLMPQSRQYDQITSSIDLLNLSETRNWDVGYIERLLVVGRLTLKMKTG